MASPANHYQNHPLPPPPQLHQSPPRQQQQPQQQPPQATQQQPPAKSRSFSFRSDKTRKNSSVSYKIDLHETHAEKDSRRIHSKADPTLAMNEAEPSVVAAMQSSLAPLRSIQHKDAYGNPIADPDKSNPTRNRWERPLDTIRSFEAAIEGDYARRSMYRAGTKTAFAGRSRPRLTAADADPVANWNRRNSYHPANQPRFPQDSYYGSRAPSVRGDSHGTARNSYYENQSYGGGGPSGSHNGQGGYGGYGDSRGYGPTPGRRPSRERTARGSSEPNYQVYGREQNVYPLPNKDRSYETVTSAAGSGSSDPAGYQTDPTSSDNSSIDRISPAKRAEPVNDYGIGFTQSQSYQSPTLSINLGTAGNHPLPSPPAPVARKEASLLRRQPSEQQPNTPEKRKSWFARRFSKNS